MTLRANSMMTWLWPCQLLLFFFLTISCSIHVSSKRISGDFKLSGVNSEKVLTSFAVTPQYGAKFTLNLTAADMYETERFLKLRLFRDEEWTRHLKVMTCQEKVRHATHSISIVFDYFDKKWQLKEPIRDVILSASQKKKYDPRKVMMNKRRAERQHAGAMDGAGGDGNGDASNAAAADYVDDAFINANERDLIQRTQAFTAERPQYWYLTLDDCMLEQTNLDNKVPMLHFDLEIVNALEPIDSIDVGNNNGNNNKRRKPGFQYTHLSADETNLVRLHFVTMLLSGGVAAMLILTAGYQSVHQKSGQATIHAAVLWVALAAALDAASSFCEIIHLKAYESNGYGNYFIDAIAAHLEALCDSFLMLLLLGIGAGWTLPTDAIRVRPNENAIQQAFTDLASPLRALLYPTKSIVGLLCWATIALHAILCQWGRTYNDDFESYHDLEHLPGKILMMMRIVLGVLLLAVTMRTHLQAKVTQLQAFYHKLALLGFIWFVSLPFVTWACNTFVPYYLRHPAVFYWSAILQSSSIVLLAWLVTSHSKNSAFAQYSHMTAGTTDGGALAESLSMGASTSSSTTKSFMFGKTKIAID